MIYPSYAQFRQWAKRYRRIPFYASIPAEKSQDPFLSFRDLSSEFDSAFFLDSFQAKPLGRFSYFPASPAREKFIADSEPQFRVQWKALQKFLEANRSPDFSAILPPFSGGAVGYLSYDCGRVFEPGWRSKMPKDPLKTPWMDFKIFDELYGFDHRRGKIFAISCVRLKEENSKNLKQVYDEKIRRLEILLAKIGAGKTVFSRPQKSLSRLNLKPAGSRQNFLRSVGKIKDYIAAGDIYQANFSQRLAGNFDGIALDYFANLRGLNPSPYAFFARLGGFELASCSPELLLKKTGRLIETRPIAGTRPRGKDAKRDRFLEGELLLHPKERAEHVMLLDLERNDLGRVCEAGSVRVSEKMIVEKYSHVMHIVSHVRGILRRDRSMFDAIASVFPGGTITGCPKVRCLEILDELEPVARGPFYGSFGWLSCNGNAEMNLIIRTALFKKSETRKKNDPNFFVQVGAGIVADSKPIFEYRESLQKAKALIQAANPSKH